MKNIRFSFGVLILLALCLFCSPAIAFPEDNSPPEQIVQASQDKDVLYQAIPDAYNSLEVQSQAECAFVILNRSCESPMIFETTPWPQPGQIQSLSRQFYSRNIKYRRWNDLSDNLQNYTSLTLPEPRHAACSAGVDLDRSCSLVLCKVANISFRESRLLFYEDDHPSEQYFTSATAVDNITLA